MTSDTPPLRCQGNATGRYSVTRFTIVLLVFVLFIEDSAGWVTLNKRPTVRLALHRGTALHDPENKAGSNIDVRSDMISRRMVFSETVKGFVATATSIVTVTCGRPRKAFAAENDGFVSSAYTRSEYTNSIVASRDTNVSPKEVYDIIRSLREKGNGGNNALDVGAGAGVSTQTLYEMGYTKIDALDWSSDAWDLNVKQNGQCPDSVRFYNLDDERFLKLWSKSIGEKYDVIVFNFAVNTDKAVHFATELLKSGGVLLAPVNAQQDYWLKQTYMVLNSEGKLLWSASDVGAWSVQFQPDVTQDTCQGIWCPPFNGFRKQ